MSLEETVEAQDTVVEAAGLKFVLDAYALRYAQGLQVDYKSSFLGKGFTVSANGRC